MTKATQFVQEDQNLFQGDSSMSKSDAIWSFNLRADLNNDLDFMFYGFGLFFGVGFFSWRSSLLSKKREEKK